MIPSSHTNKTTSLRNQDLADTSAVQVPHMDRKTFYQGFPKPEPYCLTNEPEYCLALPHPKSVGRILRLRWHIHFCYFGHSGMMGAVFFQEVNWYLKQKVSSISKWACCPSSNAWKLWLLWTRSWYQTPEWWMQFSTRGKLVFKIVEGVFYLKMGLQPIIKHMEAMTSME